MAAKQTVLFVCEKYYLRFYGPLAERLARSGYTPYGSRWTAGRHGITTISIPGAAIEHTVKDRNFTCRDDIDSLCVFVSSSVLSSNGPACSSTPIDTRRTSSAHQSVRGGLLRHGPG